MSTITTICLHLYLCVTCSAFGAAADVSILSVLAGASISTRQAQAFIDVGLTESSGVSRVAMAAERRQTIDTGTIVAWVRVTFIDIYLTVPARVTC